MYDDEEYVDDNTVILALEPGSYTHTIGMAMGTAEILREEGVVKFVTLVFLDCEGKHIPLLVATDSKVLEYLLSDKFQTDLHQQVAEIA